MKRIACLAAAVAFGSLVYSQQIERYVFNAFGSAVSANGYSLWTNAGEPLTQTYSNPSQDRVLTQGFLQPVSQTASSAAIAENPSGDFPVSVWPNPATEGLFLSFPSFTGRCIASVYDVTGKCLLQQTICTDCTEAYLPLPWLADGLYVLRLSLAGHSLKEFKFIKTAAQP